MAINQSNSDKGRNGGPMPLQGQNDGASSWSKGGKASCDYPGSRKYAGPDMPMRPKGGTPEGNPSKTPRP